VYFSFTLKKLEISRAPWFRSVISATWEAEIRRISAQGQPEQIVHETLSLK
jgi:hypothetical protein